MIEKIFLNANILTQDKKNPIASAFAVSKGKIIKVGNDDEVLSIRTSETKLHTLNYKILLPGFNDAHIHIWKVGNLMTYLLDLRGVKSIDEMQQRLLDYANKNPQLKWIQARGFNEALFVDEQMPTKYDLDKVISDRPVCVMRTCAHQIIVNTNALEAAGINSQTQSLAGGEIKKFDSGELKGHFTETALGLVMNKIPAYNHAEYRNMILAAQTSLLNVGITSATDPAVMPDLLEVYKSMDRNGELKIRVNAIPIRLPDGAVNALPIPEKYSSPHLKVDTVKFFADGGLSGMTAAMHQPYKNSNARGVLRFEKSVFKKLTAEAQQAGFRIATHAIGDAAMDLVCEVYEELWNEYKILGNRIEHVGLPSIKNLDQMLLMQINAVMQPIFIYELGRNFRHALNNTQLENVYPIKSILQKGINVALSTDAPVIKDFNPFTGIQTSITREDAEGFVIGENEKISLAESLFGYTMGSAIANNDGDNRGSIEADKFADFIILNENPFLKKNQEFAKLKTEATYVNGKCMSEAKS